MNRLTNIKRTGLGLFMLIIPLTMASQASDSLRSGCYDDEDVAPLEDAISDALITFQYQHVLENKMIFEFDRAPWILLIADIRVSNSSSLDKGCVFVMDVAGEDTPNPTAHFNKLSVEMPQDGIGIFYGDIIDNKWSISLQYHYPLGADSIKIVNLGEFRRYYENHPIEKKSIFQDYFRRHKNFQQLTPPGCITEREEIVLLKAYHRNFGLVGKRIMY